MRISIPLVMDGPAIVYPGDFALWSNTENVGDRLIGDYNGTPDFECLPVAPLSVALTADKLRAAVGEVITIQATFSQPLSGHFAVPVLNEAGQTVKIKGVDVKDGAATAAISFDRSGYYRITNEALNSRLPPGLSVQLAEAVEFTIYE